MNQGRLFVISAPSGAGKTTLLGGVMARLPLLAFSVSHTTRSPRPGEVNGKEYHFVSEEEFRTMIVAGEFLEHADVHGNLYGTSYRSVSRQQEAGFDVVLDIDVQGAAILREKKDLKATYIFIAPPSLEELERRLKGRQTETDETIALRLANAHLEMQSSNKYDYIIVNSEIDEATDLLRSIIVAERARVQPLPSDEPGGEDLL